MSKDAQHFKACMDAAARHQATNPQLAAIFRRDAMMIALGMLGV